VLELNSQLLNLRDFVIKMTNMISRRDALGAILSRPWSSMEMSTRWCPLAGGIATDNAIPGAKLIVIKAWVAHFIERIADADVVADHRGNCLTRLVSSPPRCAPFAVGKRS
jgi:hypothetical protein